MQVEDLDGLDKEVDGPRENLHPLLDLIIEHVKPAELDKTKPFAMLSTYYTQIVF